MERNGESKGWRSRQPRTPAVSVSITYENVPAASVFLVNETVDDSQHFQLFLRQCNLTFFHGVNRIPKRYKISREA